jgi:hypothetical protein
MKALSIRKDLLKLELMLGKNRITQEGANSIAQAVSNLKKLTLVNLDIADNKIAD